MDKAYSKEELDTLEKSMRNLGFSQEKIDEAIDKAKKNTDNIEKSKGEDPEDKSKDEDVEKAKETSKDNDIEDNDLKKSIDNVNKAIGEYNKATDNVNKAITAFQDLSGKLPGANAPTTTTLGKSLETDIDKSVEGKTNLDENTDVNAKESSTTETDKKDFEKSFGNGDIIKSFGDLLDSKFEERDSLIQKSLSDISDKYDKIEKSVDQFMDSPSSKSKAVTHNYSTIEKSVGSNNNGGKVVSIRNKAAVLSEMENALSKSTGSDKTKLTRAIPDFEISKSMDDDTRSIVKSMTGVEFGE